MAWMWKCVKISVCFHKGSYQMTNPIPLWIFLDWCCPPALGSQVVSCCLYLWAPACPWSLADHDLTALCWLPPQCPSQQICWCEHFGCTFIRIQLFDSWKIFFLHSVCKRVPPEDLKEILILVFHILSTTSCDYFKTVLTKHLTPFPSWWKVPNMTSPAMTHQASPIHK